MENSNDNRVNVVLQELLPTNTLAKVMLSVMSVCQSFIMSTTGGSLIILGSSLRPYPLQDLITLKLVHYDAWTVWVAGG